MNVPDYWHKYIKRFWSKVRKRDKDECWIWKAGQQNGYGVFSIWEGPVLAHRFSMMIVLERELEPSELVLHDCDNPSCVNPRHLYVGTHRRNMQDKMERGRWKGNT